MPIRGLLALLCLTAAFGCGPKTPAPTEAAAEPRTDAPDVPSRPAGKPRMVVPAASSAPLGDPPKLLSEEQVLEGWIALFDGKTLFGWVANSATEWTAEDGAIVSRPGTPGLLLTTTPWRDYELRCEAWLENGGNSGLFLRTVPHPKDPAVDCLEFNLCDTHGTFPTGSLVARAKAGERVDVEGDWHDIHLTLVGDRFTAKIDGMTILDETSPAFAATGGGRIGLQQNGGVSRFRNIFLKPLGAKPLAFDPYSSGAVIGTPSAWRPVPGSKSDFEIGEELTIKGGPGFMETAETFGDFVLQFEAKLNGKDVNSGLFFRAEPGTEAAPSNGYELQLQNTVANGDRARPADYGDGFGTGAIFRRQRARSVNADDEQWFAVTLNAEGNRFATWVNGLQVTDFVDDRKPDPNPRNGRRDDAGHISLQGHDPNTDASFRDLRIAPLP